MKTLKESILASTVSGSTAFKPIKDSNTQYSVRTTMEDWFNTAPEKFIDECLGALVKSFEYALYGCFIDIQFTDGWLHINLYTDEAGPDDTCFDFCFTEDKVSSRFEIKTLCGKQSYMIFKKDHKLSTKIYSQLSDATMVNDIKNYIKSAIDLGAIIKQ